MQASVLTGSIKKFLPCSSWGKHCNWITQHPFTSSFFHFCLVCKVWRDEHFLPCFLLVGLESSQGFGYGHRRKSARSAYKMIYFSLKGENQGETLPLCPHSCPEYTMMPETWTSTLRTRRTMHEGKNLDIHSFKS